MDLHIRRKLGLEMAAAVQTGNRYGSTPFSIFLFKQRVFVGKEESRKCILF